MRRLNIGVVFGGRSTEHQVSLLSAKNVITALDRKKYRITPIGIRPNGDFVLYRTNERFFIDEHDPKTISLSNNGVQVVLGQDGEIRRLKDGKRFARLDVVFPALHGSFGEDGCFQGLLKMMNIPFVGCGVLASTVCMDKDVTKRLLRDAGIKVIDFLTVHDSQKATLNFEKVAKKLSLPFFVKPANAGSSVGVRKVASKRQFVAALREAFRYDTKVLLEKMAIGSEIECSVLGNELPIVSLPGRVIPQHDFYSYEAKYIDEHGAEFEIPASLPKPVIARIQQIALATYRVLGCEGMARVDGFLTKKGEFIINEVNTIPGFTSISMYPKLWDVSGVNYANLIDRLISLSLQRHKRDESLETAFQVQ